MPVVFTRRNIYNYLLRFFSFIKKTVLAYIQIPSIAVAQLLVSLAFVSFVNLDKRRSILLLFIFSLFFCFLFFNLSRVRLVKYIDQRRLDFFCCRMCVVYLFLFWLLVVNVVLVVYLTYLTCAFSSSSFLCKCMRVLFLSLFSSLAIISLFFIV